MKKSSIILIVLALVSACSYAQENNTDATKIALSGYSPVSYLDLNLAQQGLKEFKSEHKGLNYYFRSVEQKAEFDKTPEKYIPQFGGWCATGIAVGAKFRTDPNKFLVQNGKLYMFLNDLEVDAKQLWTADVKGMEKKAKENWPTIKSN